MTEHSTLSKPQTAAMLDSYEKADREREKTVADALNHIVDFLQRFVVFTSRAQAVAVALWAAHTHWKADLDVTPYLAVLSAEKQSGKSRLFEVLELLVADPWYSVYPTAPVLFRRIDRDQPTLLLDEIDAIFGRKANPAEDMRGIFNAGHRRGVTVSRLSQKGKKWELEEFKVFCPKAFGGIGKLPDTISDRAIIVRLRRKKRSEEVERFRRATVAPQAEPIRDALSHAAQSLELNHHPAVPEQLSDRAAEGWEPLAAVADLAGLEWGKQARAAAVFLAGELTPDDESLGIRLLGDIRRVFEEHDQDRTLTKNLLGVLNEFEDAPWGDFYGKQLTPQGLSRILRPYEVYPKTIRTLEGRGKGYDANDFADAWTRYLGDQVVTK